MRPIPGTITDPAVTRALFRSTAHAQAPYAQLLELARSLALVVHAGQSRKGTGEPYFDHLRQVASRVGSLRAKTIAYLHDMIEDTDVTYSTLHRIGFPNDILYDVRALTRHFFKPEPYVEFIERTIRDGSLDALRVKYADLQDNLADPWVEAMTLTERHIPAAAKVLAEIIRREPAAA